MHGSPHTPPPNQACCVDTGARQNTLAAMPSSLIAFVLRKMWPRHDWEWRHIAAIYHQSRRDTLPRQRCEGENAPAGGVAEHKFLILAVHGGFRWGAEAEKALLAAVVAKGGLGDGGRFAGDAVRGVRRGCARRSSPMAT